MRGRAHPRELESLARAAGVRYGVTGRHRFVRPVAQLVQIALTTADVSPIGDANATRRREMAIRRPRANARAARWRPPATGEADTSANRDAADASGNDPPMYRRRQAAARVSFR